MDQASPYEVGSSISAGQVVGKAGDTGKNVKGIHLHVEIIDGGGKTFPSSTESRLDPATFTNWGELPAHIGTDIAGNSITLQTREVNGVISETIRAVDSSGKVLGTFPAVRNEIRDAAGNVAGYNIVADGTSAPNTCSYTILESSVTPDGRIASQTFYGATTETTTRAGITITTNIATGRRTAQVLGADGLATVAADGTISGTSGGVAFTINLPSDPLADATINVGGHSFTANAGSTIEVKNGGVNIVEGASAPSTGTASQTLTDTADGTPFQKFDSPTNSVWIYENGVTFMQFTGNAGDYQAGDMYWSIPVDGGRTMEITQYADSSNLNITRDRNGNIVSTYRTLADGTVWEDTSSGFTPGAEVVRNGIAYVTDANGNYVDKTTGVTTFDLPGAVEASVSATSGPISSITDPATLLDGQFFQKVGFNPDTTLAAPEVAGYGMANIAGQNVTYEISTSGGVTSISYSNGSQIASYQDNNGGVTTLAYDKTSDSYVMRNPDGTGSLQVGNGSPVVIGLDETIGWRDDGTPVVLNKADAGLATLQGNDPFALSQMDTADAPPSGAQTLFDALSSASNSAATLIDALSALKAIQTGEPLPILTSGLKFASDVMPRVDADGNLIASGWNVAGAASVGNGIMSLMQLDAALKRGDALGAVSAGAQTLNAGVQAYKSFATANKVVVGSSVTNLDTFLNGVPKTYTPGALPMLNLAISLSEGDAVGAAMAAISMTPAAPIAYAYYAFEAITSLFSDDTPPEAWGTAAAHWVGNEAATRATGAYGGLETATATYDGLLAALDGSLALQRTRNPGVELGIVANRLPSISFRDYSGYQLTDTDPLTGVQNAPGMHYDRTGRPYDAPPGSEQASQGLGERFVRVALGRDAIAPMWEVETAALQTQAGDPMAGLTEEERAGRAGKLAAAITNADTAQTFRPVALDLNGDGVKTTGASKTVALNVDDTGYIKSTAWLDNPSTGSGQADGFLFLDRNYNGQMDGGRELFSNGAVSLSERGLAGMRWIDSNYDGKITALDPVWDQLQVWQDANGDGVSYTDSNGDGKFDATEPSELKTLAELGITELNYAMGTFTHNGAVKQLASPDLAADAQGAATYTVNEGVILLTSQGEVSLFTTQIDDRSLLEANRDGVTGLEDVENIILGADLLANDTLAGLSGQDLSITGVGNFTHGTGFLDDNGNVHFTPDANYFGEAQFEYTLQAATGRAANDAVFVARRAA